MSKHVLSLIILLLFLGARLGFGQRPPALEESRLNYTIHFSTEKITIDGKLDENSWNEAETLSDFMLSFPVDDKKADEEIQTEIKLSYDNQNLYVGAICHGKDNYIIQTLKRDNELLRGDAFGIVIDPMNEKTNGFVFGVNPMGVQTELLITGQTGRRQVLEPGRSPNGINIAWDNKWYSEVTRHPDYWEIEIAIPFKSIRFEDNKPKWGINFFRVDAQSNSIHTWSRVPIEFTELDLGYTGELVWDNPPKKMKGNISVIPYTLGSVIRDFENGMPVLKDFQAGVDGKIAITSGINFDLTVNPDFSQVEVDEQITNLTLFNVRLPEKRLFFLENSDIFEDFGIPPMRPFFSRKIGLDEDGNPIPILFGARVSGNINKDLRIGAMNMQTRKTDLYSAQNYSALAFHKQVFSRSVLKGYFHNREAFNSPEPNYNRNVGLEFLYRSPDGRMQSFAGYSKSFNPGLSGKNYFFNSGAGYDNKNISAYCNFAGTGVNYIADMGYFRGPEYYDAVRDTIIRIGYVHWFTRGSYTLYAENSPDIISHEFGFRNIFDFNSDFNRLNHELEFNYNLQFANTGRLTVSGARNNVNLIYPFAFTDIEKYEALPVDNYIYYLGEFSYESDQRKMFSYSGGGMYGGFYNGIRRQIRFGLKYRIQPWGNFAVTFEHNSLKFPDPYGYAKLYLITPRVDINFSKKLFWTTFMQYDTQGDNFNVNSRIQWRFQPMSDIYFVYTDNYFIESGIAKNRAFVIKINYWLNL